MKDTVFFVIEDKELIVEQVLVEYNEAPIFFVCKDEKSYYIASCIDLEKERYFVATVELSSLAKMLHGQVSMRKFLLQSEEYWDVIVGEDVSQDIVVRKRIAEVCLDDLPYENAYFTVATKEIERFVENVDAKLYDEGDWEPSLGDTWKEYTEEFIKRASYEYDVLFQEIYQSVLGRVIAKGNNVEQGYEKEVVNEELRIDEEGVKLQVNIKNGNKLPLAA